MNNHLKIFTKRFYSSTVKKDKPSYTIGILGIPFCKGQRNEGVTQGPTVIRDGGIVKELIELGHNVKDYGDLKYPCAGTTLSTHKTSFQWNMKDLADVASCNKEVSRKVKEILDTNSRVLVLGGDHSLAIGSADGHARKYGDEIAMIYVDAHADLNTADTSPSGNVHGMAVALMVKELYDYWPYLPGMDWQQPVLSVKNIAYIGLRSVDQYERLIMDKFSIPAFGMAEIERYGIHKVTEMALDQVDPKGNRSLHISFDIDSLDTLEAPSTGVAGTKVRGGLTLREAVHILEIVYKTGRMRVMDVVEVNPAIGTSKDIKKTVEAAVHVIKAAFGFSRLGNVPRHVKEIPSYSSFNNLNSTEETKNSKK